jgi:ligand-binding sensor domain-containing protein
MNKKPKKIAILLYLLLCNVALSAQNKYIFENYTSDRGLSQNSCFSIAQDSDGMMWFGTQDGLNRYDGKEFRLFLPNNEAGQALPSNYISSLYFDKKNKYLWVGTIQGTCVYDVYKDSLLGITKKFSSATVLAKADIKKIVPGNKNELWFVTYSHGLHLLNTETNKTTRFFVDSINRKKVSSIVLYNGQMIAAVQNKLLALNKETGQFNDLKITIDFSEIRELFVYKNKLWAGTVAMGCFIIENPLSAGYNVKNILSTYGGIGNFTIDESGNLWIGTRGSGVLILDSSLKLISLLNNDPLDLQTIGKNFVLSLFTDRQGLVWTGLSGGGVAKYDPGNCKFQNISSKKKNDYSLPDNMVFTLHQSANGLIYAGTQNKGLALWNPAGNRFISIKESFRHRNIINTIYSITEDKANNLWIASWGGLIKLNTRTMQMHNYTDPEILVSSKLYYIHKLKNADSLFVTGENGFAFFSLKDMHWKPCKEDKNYADLIGRYVYEDASEILWIGTIGHGLVRYDYKKNSYSQIKKVNQKTKYIRHLLKDETKFWLSTENGLIEYDYVKDSILKHILPGKNTQSNVCYAAEKDNNGNIWVSSNMGLYKINTTTLAIRNYYKDYGLAFAEYNTACVAKLENGTLIFGGVGGITKFNAADFKDNNYSPAPLITAISINDSSWRPQFSIIHTNLIRLSYNQNFLTIYFAVTNFSNSGKQHFKYRLKGVSSIWTESSKVNFANYTQLKPGRYVFELQSANGDETWSKRTTKLTIIIDPPWWQQNWFLAVLIAVILWLFYYFFKIRINQVKHRAELKQKITETEMKALRVQMNPHFIFNSLNSINSFIIENKTHLASDYITKFSRLIRLILDNSTNEQITLEKEIETLQLYLLMESARFNKKFEYSIKIEEDTDTASIKIPPLLIQPFVENSIWHGLLPLKKQGRVTISISEKNNQLQIIIEDNGVGRKKAAELKSKNSNNQKSYGVKITHERITTINPMNKLIIKDSLNKNGEITGTIVTIYIHSKNFYKP